MDDPNAGSPAEESPSPNDTEVNISEKTEPLRSHLPQNMMKNLYKRGQENSKLPQRQKSESSYSPDGKISETSQS